MAFVAPAALALAPAPALAADESVDSGVARIESFLDGVQSFSANFRQRVIDSGGSVVEESTGTVVMSRPGRFRWDYAEPFQRVIVADGKRIWLYEADLEQVTVRQLTSGIGDTPAALLTGENDVLERFSVTRAWREDGLAWSSLAPRSADSDFESVRLGFEGPTLVRLELADRLGQTTRIDFTDVRTNRPVSADTFVFTVPPGADVIDDSDL